MPVLAPDPPRSSAAVPRAPWHIEEPEVEWPDWGGDEPPGDGDGRGGDDEDGGDDDPVRWTTVAAFWHPAPAHIARLRLEADDIPCLIVDENLVATDWLYANAVGGVKLQVPADDAPRARDLLARPGGEAPPGPGGTFPASGRCPRCGSDDAAPSRLSRPLVLLSVLLLGLPLPMLLSRSRCGACGCEWR